jgi:hypothetical protein
MFDLDQAISEWRRQMSAGGIRSESVLDELESHLREEVERQIRSGAHAEKAFAIAAQKIGPASALKNEFRKNGSAHALGKLMFAIAVLVAAFGVFLTTAAMILCYETLTERVTGFVALGFILLVIFGWTRVVPFLPVISNKRKRVAVALACMVAGWGMCALFVQLIVHRFERPDHMVPVIAFFGILPIAIGSVLANAIEQAARRTNLATHA